MEAVYRQLTEYYNSIRDLESNESFLKVRNSVYQAMNTYRQQHPNTSAVVCKSELHTQIAMHFEPVIFDALPFFYEMGIKPADSWGYLQRNLPSTWGLNVFPYLSTSDDPDIMSLKYFGCGCAIFDTDHHCPGYTKLFEGGIDGILNTIRTEMADETIDHKKQEFLSSAEKSCNAVLLIAEKFADAAEKKLLTCSDPKKYRNLELISQTARKIPRYAPTSFYEGLCMLWFVREVFASIEGVGISLLGHMDKLLGPLYEKDIRTAALTREEAKQLLKMWMALTYIKFDARNQAPDSSSCIELGGCDTDGMPIFNEVTRLIIEVHEEEKFTIPKINCRISPASPKEYIDCISQSIHNGHNVYAIFNDAIIIRALMENGKSLQDARNYVNGGCQETIVEGAEHSAGVYLYFNMPKVLDITLNGLGKNDEMQENTAQFYPKTIEKADSFEDFYRFFLENLKRTAYGVTSLRTRWGKNWQNIHPCPMFSATLAGCIEHGRDYSAGGASYNVSTFCAAGLATVIDSLYAIWQMVYKEKHITLQQLCQATRTDWKDQEKLRAEMIALPKYGHGISEVDLLAQRLVDDLNAYITSLENERNDHFQLSMFVYAYYFADSSCVGATPDGRKSGTYFSQGISPSTLRSASCVLDSFHSVNTVDFSKTGGINVLDLNLPYNKNLPVDVISGLIKSFVLGNGHCIQMNYISKDDLIDAQIHPEKHTDLMIRLYGFSAYFVNLGKEYQNEFLSRNFYTE